MFTLALSSPADRHLALEGCSGVLGFGLVGGVVGIQRVIGLHRFKTVGFHNR